jgi:tRNA G18 (ribose-2'-O)-methylase SpoU
VSSISVLIGFHPVTEALRAARPIERVLIANGLSGGRVQQLVRLCQ